MDRGTLIGDWLRESTKRLTWRTASLRCIGSAACSGPPARRREIELRAAEAAADERADHLRRGDESAQQYDRGQCSYKELFYLLKDMCALVGVPFPETPVPTYSSKRAITVVPEEHEVIAWVTGAPEQAGWYFGMMATFGLRDHDDGCAFIDDETVHVRVRPHRPTHQDRRARGFNAAAGVGGSL